MVQAQNAYLFLTWLHIISAAVLIGGLATFPLLRAEARRSGEATVARHNLRVLDGIGMRLLVPALVLLFATGLLMAVGPVGRWGILSPGGRWVLFGMGVWVALAAAVGVAVGVTRQMIPLAEEGEMESSRVRRLWVQHRVTVIVSAALALLAEWVMVYKPTF